MTTAHQNPLSASRPQGSNAAAALHSQLVTKPVPEKGGADALPSPRLRTPPLLNLPQRHPLGTPLGQVLPLRDPTLMDRAGQQGDAVPADLVAEVLAGQADGT
jgi:hypothetical protein